MVRIYSLLMPGILTAITGVGVGDLATAGFTGAQLGTTVLWAVLMGAAFKYCLTEGLARWQLASQQSIISGCITHLRWPFIIFLALYFFPWCWFVGSALVNAAGVAGRELLQLAGIEVSKQQSGLAHSLVALALVLFGKQRLFNPIMGLLAIILFFTVVFCAAQVPMTLSDWQQGLTPDWPSSTQQLSWIVALMGGVGGTLTVVCYGYWIAASGRAGASGLRRNRIDLAVSYTLTALFGMAMVIIGAYAHQTSKGLGLLLGIYTYFSNEHSPLLAYCFLFGAWAAIFSSLLGVWQAVPQIFADCFYQLRGQTHELPELTRSKAYRAWLLVLALLPLLSLNMSFKDAQQLYSIVGAFFMPILAAALLYLNRARFVAPLYRNNRFGRAALIVVFVFFCGVAGQTIIS